MRNFSQACRLAAIILCCALLGACGKSGGDRTVAAKGQVIAYVGHQVVTHQELENEFRWANVPVGKQQDPEIIKRVLGELVARKYLLQQALNEKLDREPGVLLDLIRAREQVLSNAALVRAAASRTPSKTAVDRYIANNPAKFADRKLLNIEQISFPFGPSGQSVVDANKNAKTLDEVGQQLTSAGVPHSRQMGKLVSDNIPPDLLRSIEAKKDGNIFFVRNGASGVFFAVKSEELSPVGGEAAVHLAQQLLRADAIKSELGIATYSANLEAKYEGKFAQIMQQGSAAKREPAPTGSSDRAQLK